MRAKSSVRPAEFSDVERRARRMTSAMTRRAKPR
jgi:hypothetical protein